MITLVRRSSNYRAHRRRGLFPASPTGNRESIELDVFEQNSTGRGFYEKYAFREISRYMHEETGQMRLRLKFGS